MGDTKLSTEKGGSPFQSFFKPGNRVADFFAGFTTFSLLVTVTIQIVGRLMGNAEPWTEELTRYIFIWMIFLGIALGFRHEESPRITILLKYLPKKLTKYFDWLYIGLTISFFAFLFYTGIELMGQQMNETSPVLRISQAWVGLSIPACAVLGILNFIQSIILSRNKEANEESGGE